MQYLFDDWNKISHRLRSADQVLFLSDFDGTLTPIVDRPELAVLDADIKKILKSLSKNHRYTVGIVSGRALMDLKDKVGIDGIIYAGNHGLEIEGFGTSFLEPIAEEIRPFFQILSQVLTIAFKGVKGVFVENKGLSVSVHYRTVDGVEEEMVEDAFNKVTNPLYITGNIKITRGKKVYEIRPPVDWDKGKAISWLIVKCKEKGRRGGAMPIYLGDDLTDESAFKVVEEYCGISIFVGNGDVESAARYYLNSTEEVESFLKML